VDLTEMALVAAVLSTLGFAVTLIRHVLFKREFYKLKEDMKKHTLEHGVNEELWILFVTRSRKMLRFWR
jgi:hypothetical protein